MLDIVTTWFLSVVKFDLVRLLFVEALVEALVRAGTTEV
jgi:hypothetical protein